MALTSPSFQDVLESAARLQALVPGLVLVGGTAAAVYGKHRISLDHDHVIQDLTNRFEHIITQLETESGWSTARTSSGKVILGSLDNVQAGIRQLRRQLPLDTVTVTVSDGHTLTIPSPVEMFRVKAIMVLTRSSARDYLDLAAVSDAIGPHISNTAIARMDEAYDAFTQTPHPILQELLRRLAHPETSDGNPQEILDELTITDPRWRSWSTVEQQLRTIANNFACQQPLNNPNPDHTPPTNTIGF